MSTNEFGFFFQSYKPLCNIWAMITNDAYRDRSPQKNSERTFCLYSKDIYIFFLYFEFIQNIF